MMARLQLLQLDSVPVVIRTQYLPAYSRLGAYKPELIDDIAYRRDEWFEVWAHEASLVPVTTEPLLRWSKERAEAGGTWKGLYELAQREPQYVESVYEEVADRGPLAPAQLSDPRPRDGEWWGTRSIGSLALDWLFRIGRLGIRRVGNFEKRFDVIDNIVPADIRQQPTPHPDDALRELLVMSAQALGVASADCLVDYFRVPPRQAKPLLDGLVEDGRLDRCEVEGWDRPLFFDPDRSVPRKVEARALLSPFDPIVWNRKRVAQIFDLEYRIEIYVPKEKRRWGYYVLPFLLGDEIVARVDVKTDRAERVLRVPAAHLEAAQDLNLVASELAAELHELAILVGCESVAVGPKGDLAQALQAAVAARH